MSEEDYLMLKDFEQLVLSGRNHSKANHIKTLTSWLGSVCNHKTKVIGIVMDAGSYCYLRMDDVDYDLRTLKTDGKSEWLFYIGEEVWVEGYFINNVIVAIDFRINK